MHFEHRACKAAARDLQRFVLQTLWTNAYVCLILICLMLDAVTNPFHVSFIHMPFIHANTFMCYFICRSMMLLCSHLLCLFPLYFSWCLHFIVCAHSFILVDDCVHVGDCHYFSLTPEWCHPHHVIMTFSFDVRHIRPMHRWFSLSRPQHVSQMFVWRWHILTHLKLFHQFPQRMGCIHMASRLVE